MMTSTAIVRMVFLAFVVALAIFFTVASVPLPSVPTREAFNGSEVAPLANVRIYPDVIRIYKERLDRMPTDAELQEGAALGMDRLRTMLPIKPPVVVAEEEQQAPPPKPKPFVLLPDQQWVVPQPRAPVCTAGSQTCIVQPSLDQTALIGTLLEDANNMQVGSIMPKFTFTEQPPQSMGTPQ